MTQSNPISPGPIELRLDNRPHYVKAGTTLAELVAQLGHEPRAIATSVNRLCEYIIRDTDAVMTVSGMLHNQYGISDVCLSLPTVIGARGVERVLPVSLNDSELSSLHASARAVRYP